jgi:predicted DCC family thiol-disulfide oxidoreductase YuxK
LVYAQVENETRFRAWYYSDAIIHIGFALGDPYKFGASLLTVMPRQVRDRIYQILARHRKKICE